MTESIGAEMGIEGFAGADYEGSIDLDLIQRAMDGAAPEAADEPIVETAVTEDTLRDEVIVEEPVLEENEEPVLEENEALKVKRRRMRQWPLMWEIQTVKR